MKDKIFKVGAFLLGGFMTLVGLEGLLLINYEWTSFQPLTLYLGLAGSLSSTFIGAHYMISSSSSLRIEGWGCNCPLCRVSFKPVAEKVSGIHVKPVEVKLEEEGGEVEEAPEPPQLEQPLQPAPQIQQENLEETLAPLIAPINEAVQSIQDKVSTLEEEVEKVRRSVENRMDEIKESLIKLRSQISEAKNPFRRLEENNLIEEVKNSDTPPNMRTLQYIKAVRWVDKMLSRMSKSLLVELVKGYIDVGVIDEGRGRVLLRTIEVVDKLRNSGVNVSEQVLSMYSLKKALGDEGGEEMLDELIEVLDEAEKK